MNKLIKASTEGLSVSGLCERLGTQGKLELVSAPDAVLHPALFADSTPASARLLYGGFP